MKRIYILTLLCFVLSISNAQQLDFDTDFNEGCAPLTVNFENLSDQVGLDTTGLTFVWDFDNGETDTSYHAQHTFDVPGEYNVSLMADSAGDYRGETFRNISVLGIRKEFMPWDSAQFCVGERVSFYFNDQNDQLEWLIEGIDSSQWNWFEVRFDTAGFYDVRLIVDHQCGRDTITQVVEITNDAIPWPDIDVNQDEACIGDHFRFTLEGDFVSTKWFFGDGDSSMVEEPSHFYADTGDYTVIAEVTNVCGNKGYDSLHVRVDTGLSAGAWFNASWPTCPNSVIEFETWSSGSYQWDFGNGATGTSQREYIAYQDTGLYRVTLLVTNGCGDIDTNYQDIYVQYDSTYTSWVDASFDSRDSDQDTMMVCPGSEVGFVNGSDMEDDVKYQWKFTEYDSLMSNEMFVTHVFDSIGWHTVSLMGQHVCGGAIYDSLWVYVSDTLSPNSELQFLPPVLCPGETAYFFDEGSNDESNNYSIWFGDGNRLLNVGPENDTVVPVTGTNTYYNLGEYPIRFSVTNLCGVTETLLDTIYVIDTITDIFAFVSSEAENPEYPACPGDMIEFYGVGGVQVEWDFGSGFEKMGNVVKHSFDQIGEHQVQARVTSGCGTVDTFQTVAYVGYGNLPYAGFEIIGGNQACVGDSVWFRGYDDREDDNLIYRWLVNDVQVGSQNELFYAFDTSGTFEVRMEVENGCGVNSESREIIVVGLFIDDSGIALQDPDCGLEDGSISGIEVKGATVSEYVWYDASHEAVDTTLNVDQLRAGLYTLEAISYLGCTVKSEAYQLVNTGAPSAPNVAVPPDYCEGETIADLVATPGSSGTINWYSDAALNNLIGTGNQLTPDYMQSILYYATETVGACESPATEVILYVGEEYLVHDSVYICFGESIWLGGELRDQEGVYFDTLMSADGCDSVIMSHLFVQAGYIDYQMAYICPGDQIWIGGDWRTSPGEYNDTLLALNGCDSIISTRLFALLSYDIQDTMYICSGDSAYLENDWQTTNGLYDDHYFTVNGCDSMVITQLIVGDVNIDRDHLALCEGDSTYFKNEWVKEAGVYFDTLVSGTSCDSILQLSLTFNPNYQTATQASICLGDSLYLNGDWRYTAGEYTEIFTSLYGCDSSVTTNLEVYIAAPGGQKAMSICSGDSILLGGAWRKEAGIYADTVQYPIVCDSIINVQLSLYPSYSEQISETICEGDSLLVGDVWRKEAGVYEVNYQSINSCDSAEIVTLSLEDCSSGLNTFAKLNWEIFPNPSSGELVFTVDQVEFKDLVIVDLTGKEVYRKEVITTRVDIDLTHLNRGVYIANYKGQTQKITIY